MVQQSDIPQDSSFLSFRSQGDAFRLTINGVEIPVAWSTAPGVPTVAPAEWFYDVSSFAGQNVELRFTTDAFTFNDEYYLDNIQFIPEPATNALLCSGTVVLTFVLRRRSRW
jgi:hypothetical protein